MSAKEKWFALIASGSKIATCAYAQLTPKRLVTQIYVEEEEVHAIYTYLYIFYILNSVIIYSI